MLNLLVTRNAKFLELKFQSKNGGLAAWEPAGAQKWLEVGFFQTMKNAHFFRFLF